MGDRRAAGARVVYSRSGGGVDARPVRSADHRARATPALASSDGRLSRVEPAAALRALRTLVSSEGLRPSDSPTRALARRFAGALRSRGSLAIARSLVP